MKKHTSFIIEAVVALASASAAMLLDLEPVVLFFLKSSSSSKASLLYCSEKASTSIPASTVCWISLSLYRSCGGRSDEANGQSF